MSCNNMYKTDFTENELCNVSHYKGKQPFGDYNALGQLQGYYWHYGDTVNLSFNIDGEVRVENDAIIYTAIGDAPTTETVGRIGQKAYNVIDEKSWECTAIVDESYTWTQDSVFTYPTDGAKSVYVTAAEYLKGKKVSVTLYNFRYEKEYTWFLDASPIININIDKELSEKFIRGTYCLTLQVFDNLSLLYIDVIKDKECVITVR